MKYLMRLIFDIIVVAAIMFFSFLLLVSLFFLTVSSSEAKNMQKNRKTIDRIRVLSNDLESSLDEMKLRLEQIDRFKNDLCDDFHGI